MPSVLTELVLLARAAGDPNAGLAMLAEGNVSGKADPEGTFWVKASGFSMNEIGPEGFVQVWSKPILDAYESELDDAGVRQALKAACYDKSRTVMPSVETFMHAYLLTLPNVSFVVHTHPEPLLALLSTEGSEALAAERFFPDEIVCCGPASCWVPYTDPGLPLAREIKSRVEGYFDVQGEYPKTIWLENHGLISLGKSANEAKSGTMMSAKAARVRLGAIASGRPLKPLTQAQIDRIHTRPDEHYRQRQLRGE